MSMADEEEEGEMRRRGASKDAGDRLETGREADTATSKRYY